MKLIFYHKQITLYCFWITIFLFLKGCIGESEHNVDVRSYSPESFNIQGEKYSYISGYPLTTFQLPEISTHPAKKPDSLPLKDKERLRVIRSDHKLTSDPKIFPLEQPESGYPQTHTFDPQAKISFLPEIIISKDPLMKTQNPFSFSFFTRTQGMPHDDISAFYFDKSGNMWITTYGAGIIRFDGHLFFHYTTEHGLPDNFIISVAEDHYGRLLFGSRNGGLIIFDGFSFLVKNQDNGFPSNRIETIFIDSQDNIWLGTFGSGIILIKDDTFYSFHPDDGFPVNTVYSIAEEPGGDIWFGTRGDGLLRYDGNAFYLMDTTHGLNDNYVTKLLFDHQGYLWIGTDGKGVTRFDGTYFSHFLIFPHALASEITAIYEDKNNEIWFGTRSAGLLRFTGSELLRYTESDGLVNVFITHIQADRANNLWFATYGGGIGLYRGDFFRHYTDSEGFPDPFMRIFREDSDGNLWMGSNSGGAFIYKKSHLWRYLPTHGLQDHRIRGLYADSQKNMLIGYLYNGLSIFDGEMFSIFSEHPVLSDISVLSVIEEDDGTLWLGTYGDGLIKIQNNRVTQYLTDHGLSNNFIRKILLDKDDQIWIATRDGGLNVLQKSGDIVQYTEKEGFPVNELFDIHIDNNNALWIASNGAGVFRYKDGVFINYTERNGLGSNFVYAILEDHQHRLWFGTRWGLSLFLGYDSTPENILRETFVHNANAAGVFFRNFAHNDGFMGIGVNSRAMYQDKDGFIWIGANDVVTRVNPDEIPMDTIAPAIYMSWVGLYNESVSWPSLLQNQDSVFSLANGVVVKDYSFTGVSSWYGTPIDLTLSHANNYIVFSYSAVGGSLRDDYRFQYYLEGFDNQWGALTRRTEAHFGNLAPGKYTFKVRAMNATGVYSDELHFAFKIKPPWWLTWWALAFYGLFFSALVFMGFYLYRRRRIVKEKKRQEEMKLHHELELAKKSVEFKQNFLANMSHEIRTPLTGILGMADMLSKTPLNETQDDYLKTLIHSGKNLRETINLVLDYSKIEAGKVKLKKTVFSTERIIEDAGNFFHSINRKKTQLISHTDSEIPDFVKADYNRILQVLSNLISNAVKFTEMGEIELSAYVDPSWNKTDPECTIWISVRDSGVGIDKEAQKNLFKPFYQVEQSFNRSHDGTGLGLAICHELVEMLGGEILVESEVGKGSTFSFSFKATVEAKDNLTYEDHPDSSLSYPLKNLQILLVEDKVVNQKVVSLILKSMGHKVVVAENGEEALEVFQTGVFDLILMDIQMPVMDGITATRILRERFTNSPPIVGLSANAFEGDREKYMKLGMDEYLTKPIREEDFRYVFYKMNVFDRHTR